jgi:hypothetical protein
MSGTKTESKLSEEKSSPKQSKGKLLPGEIDKPKIFGLEIQSGKPLKINFRLDKKLFICPYDGCGRIFHEKRNLKSHTMIHVIGI